MVQLNDVKLNIPKGEGKLAQLRLEGFIFHMSMPLDTPVTTYQSICLNGALGSLGDSVAYRREGYDKVLYTHYNNTTLLHLSLKYYSGCIWTTGHDSAASCWRNSSCGPFLL